MLSKSILAGLFVTTIAFASVPGDVNAGWRRCGCNNGYSNNGWGNGGWGNGRLIGGMWGRGNNNGNYASNGTYYGSGTTYSTVNSNGTTTYTDSNAVNNTVPATAPQPYTTAYPPQDNVIRNNNPAPIPGTDNYAPNENASGKINPARGNVDRGTTGPAITNPPGTQNSTPVDTTPGEPTPRNTDRGTTGPAITAPAPAPAPTAK